MLKGSTLVFFSSLEILLGVKNSLEERLLAAISINSSIHKLICRNKMFRMNVKAIFIRYVLLSIHFSWFTNFEDNENWLGSATVLQFCLVSSIHGVFFRPILLSSDQPLSGSALSIFLSLSRTAWCKDYEAVINTFDIFNAQLQTRHRWSERKMLQPLPWW